MSVLSLALAIERFRYYKAVQPDQFTDKLTLEIALTKRLHALATIGSSAPYIGLMGTVLGIMLTFQTIGTEGFLDTGGLMVGLSMALKATVLGLFVAIPAVVFYNFLLRRARVLLMEWEVRHARKGI
jgi:biopolymer transport protein ExbB